IGSLSSSIRKALFPFVVQEPPAEGEASSDVVEQEALPQDPVKADVVEQEALPQVDVEE
ncbi:unnamed protein product, partial [Amoebophrya sp. A25]